MLDMTFWEFFLDVLKGGYGTLSHVAYLGFFLLALTLFSTVLTYKINRVVQYEFVTVFFIIALLNLFFIAHGHESRTNPPSAGTLVDAAKTIEDPSRADLMAEYFSINGIERYDELSNHQLVMAMEYANKVDLPESKRHAVIKELSGRTGITPPDATPPPLVTSAVVSALGGRE